MSLELFYPVSILFLSLLISFRDRETTGKRKKRNSDILVAVQPWRHKHDIERIYCITHCCQPASRLQNNSSRTHYARWLLKVRANDCAHGDSNLISTSSPLPSTSVECFLCKKTRRKRRYTITHNRESFALYHKQWRETFYIYIFLTFDYFRSPTKRTYYLGVALNCHSTNINFPIGDKKCREIHQ